MFLKSLKKISQNEIPNLKMPKFFVGNFIFDILQKSKLPTLTENSFGINS